MLTLEEIFPPFGLRIACGDVELTVLRDDDLPELVELVRGGIADQGSPMPFLRAWHEEPYEPGSAGAFPATSLAWWWSQRATFAPHGWQLALVVRRAGEVVGLQDLHAEHFAQARHVETGSWLGRAHQGRGTGTLMRRLAVGLAFDGLGAATCGSAYIAGNAASAAVSRKVGYVDNGRQRIVQHTRDGVVGSVEHRVVVTPETFVRPDADVVLEGVGALRRFWGLDA
ncbi:GNAT family N-acetyltransferase [Nocardioides perillae]|uniref:RimJ/RimL family protein N-acetyltransferase n=1 Tax=Nocardioides perillae TaxID=1119534 RepID=A0A7Y9RWM3_9ACTN|nr:GNAT family N-acetyltransferase [Nocardioides perillae]NYG55898.1 RimJ/RimL family protein N-acetyltransferase [Nocardioides perillae]